LDDDIRLETLAEVASLSRFHFERTYAARVGEPPMATVRRLRLKRARQLLLEGTKSSITTLAAQSGYGSVAAFSRAFSRAFSLSPTETLRLQSSGLVAVGPVPINEPKLDIVDLPAVPVVRHPFSGPAADVFAAGDEFSWVIARVCLGNGHWRHWVVHPDGWIDPTVRPDAWVRMWHCAPSGKLPLSIPGAERGFLPPGSYARFVLVGRQVANIPEMIARVAEETSWQVIDGPMLRHYPDVTDYTPVAERVTQFFLAVARR
jgi:AraC family transcriptional regulator